MKVRLSSRRVAAEVVALCALLAPARAVFAQTAPVAASKLSETAPNAKRPVVKPVETATKPSSDLEFKPSETELKLTPKEAPQTAALSPGKAPVAVPPVTVPVVAPAPVPGGPKVIDDGPPPGMVAVPPAVPGSVSGASAGAVKQAKSYVIGPLDVLEVRVWNDAKLSGMFDVGTDGMISMPLLGQIEANGLTAGELTVVIRQKLTQLIIEPEVNVQVLRNNSKKYTIFGGCARQGEFPLVGDVTLLDAFANCGGFKEFANKKKIYVLRGTKQIKFNYNDAIKGKHPETNILLQNGDRIVVPE